jgi:uncharacterized protein (DUF2267 family)
MDYQEFLQEVVKLEFIRDEVTAERAIKTVLGVLASKLEEPRAIKLAENLPHPLALDELRNYQIEELPIPVEETIDTIGAHLQLDHEQVRILVNTVLHFAKNYMGDSTVTEIERDLPMDWILTLEKA